MVSDKWQELLKKKELDEKVLEGLETEGVFGHPLQLGKVVLH